MKITRRITSRIKRRVTRRYVAYLRKSTEKQRIFSLLEQERLIREYVRLHRGVLLGIYREVGSERQNDDLPERDRAIMQTLADAEVFGSTTLLVKSIDRLTREDQYFDTLMEMGLRVRDVSQPTATPTRLRVKVQEAWLLNEFKQGRAIFRNELRRKAGGVSGDPTRGASRTDKSIRFSHMIWPIIRRLQRRGITSLNAIANELNRIGVVTRTKKGKNGKKAKWRREQVKRVCEANAETRQTLYAPNMDRSRTRNAFETEEAWVNWWTSPSPATPGNSGL